MHSGYKTDGNPYPAVQGIDGTAAPDVEFQGKCRVPLRASGAEGHAALVEW